MPLALLAFLAPMRNEQYASGRIYSREEILTAARTFCERHKFAYPGDQTVADGYNGIKQPALRRELGII